MYKYTALAALLAAAAPAHAGELVPYAAASMKLGSINGIAYYTEDFRVVATLADGETGLPVWFGVTLADDQSLTISVPGMVGEPAQVIEITRAGDKLTVSSPLTRAAALVAPGAQDVAH